MGTTTANMNLSVPSSGDSDYPQQVSDTLSLVDVHDHSTGKGVPIPTSGLADGAVNGKKLSVKYDVFDYVIGSAAQVTAGIATHSSFAAFKADAAAYLNGKSVLILPGTYTENFVSTKRLFIQGKGQESILDGTLTMDTGSSLSTIRNMKFTGNVTFNATTGGIFFSENYLATSKKVFDSGAGNSYKYIQE